MIVRNGILSNLRAKGRTALFTALILVLTVALSLGLGLWAYCGEMLAKCEESYESIALVEYMGAEYPDEDAADSYARAAFDALDDEAIRGVEGVQAWERTDRTLAALEGYERTSGTLPYGDQGVMVLGNWLSDYPTVAIMTAVEDESELPETYLVFHPVADWAMDPLTTSSYAGFFDGYTFHDGDRVVEIPLYQSMNYGFGTTYTHRYWSEETKSWAEEAVSNKEVESREHYLCYDMGMGYQLVGDVRFDRDNPEYPVYVLAPWDDTLYACETQVDYYRGLISKVLYTKEGKDNLLCELKPGNTGLEVDLNKRYLVHGSFYATGQNGGRGFVLTDFYEGCETPPYVELTPENEYLLTEGVFADYAQRYRTGNNYVRLEASADLASLDVFQQGTLYLTEGRFPEAGEEGAVVLSGKTAAVMGVGVGDTVTLTTLASQEDDRFVLEPTQDVRELTVVGVTVQSDDYDGYAWVSDAEGGFDSAFYGYQLGRVVLDNARGRAAVEELQALMPDQVRVTLYDQGYAAAAQPLETMRTTALAITLASAAGALAVLVLFAFLFVGRQRETVQILSSLGTSGGKTALWLLSGAGVICGVSALLGGAIGGALLGRVIRLALSAAQGLYETDLRFSEAAVGVRRAMDYTVEGLAWPAVAAALAVFAVGMLLCLLFLRQARRQDAPKKGRLKVRTPKGGTSVAGRGVLRFAWRGIRRGGLRSCVVPAAALVLALFLGVLGSTAQGWEQQIDALYDETTISGQVVSINGRSYSGLSVPATTVRKLVNSGLTENIGVSVEWHYWLDGEMPDFGGGEFASGFQKRWINRQPEVVALNRLDAAAEFYYSGAELEYLEGWDERFLAGDCQSYYAVGWGLAEERQACPALVSAQFLEEQGLELGDTFSVIYNYVDFSGQDCPTPLTLRVVGSFRQRSEKSNIYVPLGYYMPVEMLLGEEDLFDGGRPPLGYAQTAEDYEMMLRSNAKFSTCRFDLRSAYDLEEMRDYLEGNKFSLVGDTRALRTAVLLHDASFTETLGGLGRYIAFGTILFPILLAVVGVLGFIISWLMINSRRMEFAVMRGLGARKGTVFLTFFTEQALLCLLGCALACVVLLFLPGGGALRWLAVLGFLVCYLAGCALSVLAVGRTKLMSLLSERE